MNKLKIILLLAIGFLSCEQQIKTAQRQFLTEDIPTTVPIAFQKDIIPNDKLIHKGTFSPDLKAYHYSLSDKNFENFDVFVIHQEDGQWSEPKQAFFNSTYDEHGMSFSPDGNSIYFSSTRPVGIDSIPATWHIWKSDRVQGRWTEPTFVDIPNLRDKLTSHPTIAKSGSLYFHSSNLDYSQMDIYQSKLVNNKFEAAEKVSIDLDESSGTCTPYVSPDEDFLIFASIGPQLDLYVSFRDGQGRWTDVKRLPDDINSLGQGNPYVTPDRRFLFFTTGEYQDKQWEVKWVNVKAELQND
ncbi:MAG: hypothetical protein AAFV25_27650 [Bacteroidota bacterium]